MIPTQLTTLTTRKRSKRANKTLLFSPHWELLDHVRRISLHSYCENHRIPIALPQSLEFKLLAKGSIHSLHIRHTEQVRSYFVKIIDKENREPPELDRDKQERGSTLTHHSIESNSTLHNPNGTKRQHFPIPSKKTMGRREEGLSNLKQSYPNPGNISPKRPIPNLM